VFEEFTSEDLGGVLGEVKIELAKFCTGRSTANAFDELTGLAPNVLGGAFSAGDEGLSISLP
jgi:hypothetical protein